MNRYYHTFNRNYFPRFMAWLLLSLFTIHYSLFTMPAHGASAPIGGPGPAMIGGGGNLTTFAGGTGAVNNNQWNQMMNPNRTPDAAQLPAADFGNCNAIIMRCAQPKCPGGGCIDMAIATPIVNGCVAANAGCKQYGDELVAAISAQLVASATNKAQATQAQMAAASAAAAASAQNDAAAQQVAAMQQQMQQMQQQIASDQAAQQQQMAAALAAQQAAAAAAAAQPAPAAPSGGAVSTTIPANVISDAAARGVSADIIARNQASGQILSQLENVSAAMKNVKKAMQDAFAYAGCDSRGENCTGPKRVSAFKVKASAFFDPFETVQEEVYNALIQAQALGVDISDIYMMLSSSCNVWGQYLCEGDQILRFSSCVCDTGCTPLNNGRCAPSQEMVGKIIPPAMGGCQLLRTLGTGDTVYQSWLDVQSEEKSNRLISVACASDALSTSGFFKNLRMNVDDVGTDDLAAVLSADVIMPTKGAPTKEQMAICAGNDLQPVNSARLSSILISKRLNATSGVEGQSEIGKWQPTISESSARAAVGATYDTEKNNCINTGGTYLNISCSCPAAKPNFLPTRGCLSNKDYIGSPEDKALMAKVRADKDLCELNGNGIWNPNTLKCLPKTLPANVKLTPTNSIESMMAPKDPFTGKPLISPLTPSAH